MERLMEDAVHVQSLLPWIESDEDIINFMRKIPLDKSHLRNQLTLRYFLKERDDSSGDGFEKDIEDDAREIVIVMPGTSYKEIKDRLTILGNMPNRKEAVLRQLLCKKPELDKIVREIDSSCCKKRKSDQPNEVYDLSSNETNIKIKIRKIEGSLEVVSSIKEKTSPLKTTPSTEPSSSSKSSSSTTTLSESGISNSETSTPDSTVSTPAAETEDLSDITDLLTQENTTNVQPSTSGVERPVGYWKNWKQSTSTRSKDNDFVVVSFSNYKRGKSMQSLYKAKEEGHIESNMDKYDKNIGDAKSKFNLIDYVHNVSQYSKDRIRNLCENHKLDLNERPTAEKLNLVLNELYDNDIVDDKDIADSDIADSCSDSETEEYTYRDKTMQHEELADNSQVTNALSLPKSTVSQPNLPNPIIRPSRFNVPDPHTRAENIIPALPRHFDRQDKKTAMKQPVPQSDWPSVDLTMPEGRKPSHSISSILDMAGPSAAPKAKVRNVDETLVLRLIEMFPEACSEYIRDACDGKKWSDFNDVVTVLLSEDCPKRPKRIRSPAKEVDPEEQLQILKELLPDADPDFLRMQSDKFASDDAGLKEFINTAMESRKYPTMKEYLRKQQLSTQQKQYTTEFSIKKFVELFPEPEKTFNDPKRVVQVDPMASHYIVLYFRNKYQKISARHIQQELVANNFRVIPSDNNFLKMMKNSKNIMKTRRKPVQLPENLQNIPLLQEIAYVNHKEEIEEYLVDKKRREEQERIDAKRQGLMKTCQCCYDEEVMPKDTFQCPNGCEFCKDCIRKGCEVAFGEGKLIFPCLADCSSEFTLQTLQNVLQPKMFSKIAQKKAVEEIKAAGIEDLATCPFCDFASIPNEGDKIFRCLNPDCMKESCRLCGEPNHVPLKCEEVERDEDVKARVHVEDAMTKALIRKCWKCGTSFFKEEGCNKMTCSCGAQMCYICKEPVKDYSHFNGIGGDKFHLCPLYSDTNLVNQENVLKAAAAAKAEIDESKLKVDPTADVATHYSDRRKKLPREPHMDLLNIRHQVLQGNPHHNLHHHLAHHMPFAQQRHGMGMNLVRHQYLPVPEREQAPLPLVQQQAHVPVERQQAPVHLGFQPAPAPLDQQQVLPHERERRYDIINQPNELMNEAMGLEREIRAIRNIQDQDFGAARNNLELNEVLNELMNELLKGVIRFLERIWATWDNPDQALQNCLQLNELLDKAVVFVERIRARMARLDNQDRAAQNNLEKNELLNEAMVFVERIRARMARLDNRDQAAQNNLAPNELLNEVIGLVERIRATWNNQDQAAQNNLEPNELRNEVMGLVERIRATWNNQDQAAQNNLEPNELLNEGFLEHLRVTQDNQDRAGQNILVPDSPPHALRDVNNTPVPNVRAPPMLLRDTKRRAKRQREEEAFARHIERTKSKNKK